MRRNTRAVSSLLLLLCVLLFVSAKPASEEFDPEALWLTWQRQPDTTMTVLWLQPIERQDRRLMYRQSNEQTWQTVKAEQKALPAPKDKTALYQVELTGLQPDSDYIIRTGADGKNFRFHTLPSTLTAPLRFVAGGDLYGVPSDFERTSRQAAKVDPMFVLAGGDLAYAYHHDKKTIPIVRWVEFLSAWKRSMVTPDNRLIPIVPAIGNHDVDGGVGEPTIDASLFGLFFPMPGVNGYQALDFGDYMSLILLDSNHAHPVEGEQTQWLAQALQERRGKQHLFVMYHVPAYPSVREFAGPTNEQIRQFWVPLFEQGGVSTVFENHEHAYKRSHLITNGAASNRGVLYLGDGGWGVKPREPARVSSRWYLAKVAGKQNFITVTIAPSFRHFTAIDTYGRTFDNYQQAVITRLPKPAELPEPALTR